jgi:hypothetical protein
MIVGKNSENEYIGVMMAKKFKDNRRVFQFKTAVFTQCHENLSSSILDTELAPCESSCIRCEAMIFSSALRKLQCEGV